MDNAELVMDRRVKGKSVLIYLRNEPFIVKRVPASAYSQTGDDVWSDAVITGWICCVGEEDSVHDLPPNERS